MAHLHSVYDTDLHFSINTTTRAVTNATDKSKLVQHDHNSERITFEIPRYVEGHDMSMCDKIEIHYINISASKGDQSKDVYLSTDAQISPADNGVVIFSWLISANATKYAGTLNFLVRFVCLNGETIEYAWNTEVFDGITVAAGMDNGEAVIEPYSDILEAWKVGSLAQAEAMMNRTETARNEAVEALTQTEAAKDEALTALEQAEEVIESIPEDYTNLANGVVYKEDLLETVVENLLDISTKKVGLLHNTNGQIYTGGSYDAYRYFEQYIPVSAGDVLSSQYTRPNGVRCWILTDSEPNYKLNFSRVVAYDENHDLLGALGASAVPTYTVPDGVSFVRIAVGETLDYLTEISIVKNATEVLPYVEYGEWTGTIKSEFLPTDQKEVLAFLPSEIVCAVGRTIEIYNSQVCPYANKYHFRWICSVGKALKRKFSVTATEALIGNRSLVLEIYNDDLKIVYTKTATLKIVANTISSAKSICPIGDSLTNGKYWLEEVRALSGNQISFVGTRGGVNGLKHEGRSGFSSKAYLANTAYSYENEGVHPFWDDANGKFSWSYYKTNSGISPDAVQIFLGTNDLAGVITPEQLATNVQTMVDDIRGTDTSIPIFVVLTLCWGNQNGIGNQTSSDGFASQVGRFKYNEDVNTINGVKALYEKLKDYDNLYFIPLTQCHDSEYNFGSVETPVNPRATQTELLPTEGAHPQKQGYEQFADIMYSVYCGAFG